MAGVLQDKNKILLSEPCAARNARILHCAERRKEHRTSFQNITIRYRGDRRGNPLIEKRPCRFRALSRRDEELSVPMGRRNFRNASPRMTEHERAGE